MTPDRNLFANCQLVDSGADYLWVNAWNFQNAPGGDVYLGDLAGNHLFRGNVTGLVFNADGSASLEAAGVYVADAPHGGSSLLSSIRLDFLTGNKVSFVVTRSGLEEWAHASIPYPAGAVIY
jgi:hypothetical protein